MFLDEMAKEAKNIITTICEEQCTMSDKVGSKMKWWYMYKFVFDECASPYIFMQLLPKHCALLISQVITRKRKDKNKKNGFEIEKPGIETYRKTRENLTTYVKQ